MYAGTKYFYRMNNPNHPNHPNQDDMPLISVLQALADHVRVEIVRLRKDDIETVFTGLLSSVSSVDKKMVSQRSMKNSWLFYVP
ncbi:hypothetical protein WAX46_04895 [Bacillus sp. FJAT-53060]|uniref:hypothetical protein n=1 Tax=Bacillus TaxID=1386 RepID=UPI001CFC32B1|nr:hypothetical protein [Bacillus stratosphericus]